MNPTFSSASSEKIPFDSAAMHQARLAAGLTIEEAASMTGLNKMTIQRYESGDIHQISPTRLLNLACVYHRPPLSLIGIPTSRDFFFDFGSGCTPCYFAPEGALPPAYPGKLILAVKRGLSHF